MVPAVGTSVWIVRRKYPDSQHYEMQGEVLGEDEHGVWVGAHRGWAFRQKDGSVIEVDNANLWCVPRDDWFLVHLPVDHPEGLEAYVDICTPAVWHDDRVVVIDLDLDLDIWRDRTPRAVVVDEDEFAAHQVTLGYPPHLIAGAERRDRGAGPGARQRGAVHVRVGGALAGPARADLSAARFAANLPPTARIVRFAPPQAGETRRVARRRRARAERHRPAKPPAPTPIRRASCAAPMLLTLSTTHAPATDLGFLLHKHPDRVHAVDLPFGRATVAFPEASDERCTAALVVEVDPVGLVRDRTGPSGAGTGGLGQYVNDRPYVASSFMSAAIGRLFGTALTGRSKERPDLAATSIPLEIHLPVLRARGGVRLVERLFEPLHWDVDARTLTYGDAIASVIGRADSPYLAVTLTGHATVQRALEHLYVLLPVLDDAKHYWVGRDEIDKLLRRGGAWLGSHPDNELIAHRYLRYDRALAADALQRLLDAEPDDVDTRADEGEAAEAAVEEKVSLNEQRLAAVVAAVKASGARSVADLGCGDGKLLQRLLAQTECSLTGVDVSTRALHAAARRLRLDRAAPRTKGRVSLRQGALTYRDRALATVDAACLVEVIEHLDPDRLDALERVVFVHARPATVVVTTPNVEHNVRFGLEPAALRHGDHRFEWTRAEFASWADRVATANGYTVVHQGIGADDAEVGPPTQMATFRLTGAP